MTIQQLTEAVAVEYQADGSFQLRALRRLSRDEVIEAGMFLIWLNRHLKVNGGRPAFAQLSRN